MDNNVVFPWLLRKYALLACMLGLFLLTALAALGQPTLAEFGFIEGSLTFKDGTPLPGVSIRVTGNNTVAYLMTTADGSFTGMAPVGTVVLVAPGISRQVTVVGGATVEVKMVLEQPGVLITVKYADDTPALSQITSAAIRMGTKSVAVSVAPYDKGVFWVNGVPAEATALTVLGSNQQGGVLGDTQFRQQWALGKQDARVLTCIAPKPTEINIPLLDGVQQPLSNATVTGRITYTKRVLALWEDEQPELKEINESRELRLASDSRGMVRLGVCGTGAYTLTLAASGQVGKPLEFTVKPDGVTNLMQYVIGGKLRNVTQTVFTTEGKPAANCDVRASYCWFGKIRFINARSDQQGVVAWTDLPGAGDHLGAKYSTVTHFPDALVVATPVPIPTDGKRRIVRASIENPAPGIQRLGWAYQFAGALVQTTDSVAVINAVMNPEAPGAVNLSLTPDVPFSLVVVTRTGPVRMGVITDVYLPQIDPLLPATEVINLSVTLADAISARIRCQTAEQRPVSGFSQVQVRAEKPEAFHPLLLSPQVAGYGILRPTQLADGTVSVAMPAAGVYRLLVDLYEETAPPPAQLTFMAKESGQEVLLTMPDPVVTVPAGAEVNWVTRNTPADAHRLLVPAFAPTMPLYGPAEQLLALWYRKGTDTLVVRNYAGAAPVETTYPLRTIYFTPRLENGMDANQYVQRIHPLLPVSRIDLIQGRFGISTTVNTDIGAVRLSGSDRYMVTLWNAPHLLGEIAPLSRFSRLDLPTYPTPEVTAVTIPRLRVPDQRNRIVQLNFPKTTVTGIQAPYAALVCDVPTPPPGPTLPIATLANQPRINIPVDAKTMTVMLLGVGVIRNVPIPAQEGAGIAVINLPAWEPGVQVSGTIALPDGRPYVGQLEVSVGTGLQHEVLQTKTGTDGTFSVNGLPAGTIFLTPKSFHDAAYRLQVGLTGEKNVTIQLVNTPTRVVCITPYNSCVFWWVPDTGAPLALPTRVRESLLSNFPVEAGTLWGLTVNGLGASLRLTDGLVTSVTLPATSGPNLGILLPLEGADALPGILTLTGLEARAGLTVSFSNLIWQPSTALNLITGQINGVPPGKYRVRVETTNGPLEETVTVTEGGWVKLENPVRVGSQLPDVRLAFPL